MAAGITAMSSAALFIRIAQSDGAPSIVIAAYRLSIAALVLSIPVLVRRAWREYAKLDPKALVSLLGSGVLLGLHFASWITSLEHTSVVSSLVLVSTTPLWIGLAAPLVLHETTPFLTWLGCLSAMAGGVVIAVADSTIGNQLTLWGNLLALCGALFMAGYLLIGRGVRNRMSLLPYLWVVYGTAGLLLLGWAAAARLPLWGYSPRTYLMFIVLGIGPQLIGHSAANYAVRHISATLVAIMILGEPVGSTVLAAIFLHELPGWMQTAGGVFILAGIGLATLAEERGRRRLAARNAISAEQGLKEEPYVENHMF
jgi:drug/metabolite transporter (DMT)-like permease